VQIKIKNMGGRDDVSLKNIDLRLLECAEVLLRECNVTVAAERLQMSQGNMSNSLARLRELLGDPLLVRTARGMVPTERALELRPRVHELVRQLSLLLETSGERDISLVQRSIKIACADATALIALGPLLVGIEQVAPNLQLEISQILNFRVKEPLGDGSIDLAIGAYPDLSDSLQVSRLISGRMMCAVRAGSEFARRGLDLDTYCEAAHGVLSVGAGFRATVEMATDDALAEVGKQRKVRLSSQYATVIADAAAHSDLVATMPDFMLRQFAKNFPLEIIEAPIDLPEFALSLVWHPRAKDDWVLSWFRQRLRRCLLRAQGKSDALIDHTDD
jgi:DNA-binding transcriptional LysR family regulator